MNTNSSRSAGDAPATKRVISASKMGVRIVSFLFAQPKSKLSHSLEAVDSVFIPRSESICTNSALIRMQAAVLIVPLGLCLGTGVSVLTSFDPPIKVALMIAIPIITFAVALRLRFCRVVNRYLQALDMLSGGDTLSMSFSSGTEVIDAAQKVLDDKVSEMRRIRDESPANSQDTKRALELERQLLQAVHTFDGVSCVFTGPAKTILRDRGVTI